MNHQPPRRLHFIGHGDVADKGQGITRTLGFTDEEGNLLPPDPRLLVDIIRGRRGRGLELVFLNACDTEEFGNRLHREADVPFVVCWRYPTASCAAMIFGTVFYDVCAQPRGGRSKLEHYCMALDEATRKIRSVMTYPKDKNGDEIKEPGRKIHKYELRDRGRDDKTIRQRPPYAVGYPLLICKNEEGATQTFMPSGLKSMSVPESPRVQPPGPGDTAATLNAPAPPAASYNSSAGSA